jgi:hypothetical protein
LDQSDHFVQQLFMVKILRVLVLMILTVPASGQQIEISLGPEEIGESTLWPITITIHNGEIKSYDKFPDIKGFRKRDESQRSSTSYINGQVSSFQSRTMYYSPLQTGVITVPSFTMNINGKPFRVEGKKVTVKKGGVKSQQQNRYPGLTPNDFFDDEEPEYVEVEDDAFLAVATDKSEVYVGEGVNATLAFYRGVNNRAILDFYEIGKQLTDILKELKPTNCWEENFNIEKIEGERVTVNGKEYMRYKIYEAMFFPYNSEPIHFPSVSLEMLKYKVARSPSFFRPNRQEAFKTFHSKAKTVKVKELPPHPLKNSVAVGDFRLAEQIAKTEITTGESTSFEFNIYGEGNIASLPKPITKAGDVFEIYDPTTRQEIATTGSKITGTKSFRYFIIPKEPGKYNLGEYFNWVYFSPTKKKYDTLSSNIVVNITGESKVNEAIESYDPGNFYDNASIADNTLRTIENRNWLRWVFQGFIGLIVASSAFLIFRKS